MATKLSVIIADFTTSLATAMAAGATSASLQSATDDDGNALPSGTYYLALDGNNSQKEHIQAALSGTSLTNIKSVSRQGVLTVGCARAHRVGASVTLTDFATLRYLADLLTGATDLDSTTPLKYDGTASISNAAHLATKKYVDDTAVAGGPNASDTTKGVTKLSVAPASGTNPIAVGDNDTRVPTAGQAAALPGNNASIPVGSGNKYVTQTGLQIGTEVYAADGGASDTYAITLAPVPAAYTTGMTIRFKANTANTGAASLNVNSLGAKTIKKALNQDLNDNDIQAGQIVQVVYDGTNFQLLSPISNSVIYKSGTATRAGDAASGSQTIAHGLAVAPKFIRIVAVKSSAVGNLSQSVGVYNGSASSDIFSMFDASTGFVGVDTTMIDIHSDGTGTVKQVATITVDATNITLTWTKTGSPNSNTINLMWEAQA